MILYPAIDILGGRAVRLVQGDFDRSTEYAEPHGASVQDVDRWIEDHAAAPSQALTQLASSASPS